MVKDFFVAHPSVMVGLIIFVVIVILYFIVKQFIKLALIVLIIALAVGGYFYLKDPDKVKDSIGKVKTGTEAVVDKSKQFYKDGKQLIDKGKEVPGEVDKLMKEVKEKKRD